MMKAEIHEALSSAKTIAAFVILYLAIGNAFLAANADTCSQGSADSPTGIVLSAGLFGVAMLLLRKRRLHWAGYLLLTPLMAMFIAQAHFALRLFVDTQFYGLSICTVMFREDYGPPELDSQWVIYAWFFTYLIVGGWQLWLWLSGLCRLLAYFNSAKST